MRNLVQTAAILVLLGCSRAPEPVTTYFIYDYTETMKELERRGGQQLLLQDDHDFDESATDPYSILQSQRWMLFGDGPFPVTFTGFDDGRGPPMKVCRLEIGRASTHRPFPLLFVFDLLDDQRLATRLRTQVIAALRGTSSAHPYEFERTMEGIRVKLVNDQYGRVHIILDGCARLLPPRNRESSFYFPQYDVTFPRD